MIGVYFRDILGNRQIEYVAPESLVVKHFRLNFCKQIMVKDKVFSKETKRGKGFVEKRLSNQKMN